MPGQTKTQPGKKPGPTGRYAICPWSHTPGVHKLVAKQVSRSAKGNQWFRCVCGVRVYAPPHHPVPPGTKKDMLNSGAIIPDEM